jgi:hypothetical protein
MATTTNSYFCYPVYADGVTFATNSSGVAWGAYGPWVTIVPTNTITTPINICGLSFQFGSASGAGVLQEYVIELGYGTAGSETTVIQFPISYRNISGIGQTKPLTILVPEPIPIVANVRITVRGSNNLTGGSSISLAKIIYQV